MFKFSNSIAAILTIVFSARLALADITWVPSESSYDTGLGSVSFMVPPVPGIPAGVGMTSTGSPAYGAGANTNGVFVFSITNSIPLTPNSLPSMSQTDLSGTALQAGTVLSLIFSKGAEDRLNYLAIIADATNYATAKNIKYEILTATKFRVTAVIANPVASASGDTQASFGLLVDYQGGSQFNFGGTLFVTDMHYLDINAPTEFPQGVAGIKANGILGSEARFWAFMPLPFMTQTIGVQPEGASALNGYIDGLTVDPSAFQNDGIKTDLGFEFADITDPTNSVAVLRVSNSSWSAHNIQFGKLTVSAPTPTATAAPTPTVVPTIDISGPIITLTGKALITVKSASAKIKGTASDPAGVAALQYSTKAASGPYKSARLSGGAWTISLTKLAKGKTVKVYIRARDGLRNLSNVLVVKVKRK